MHPRGNALHEKLRAAFQASDAKLLKEAYEDICSVLTEPEIFQPKCLPHGTPSCISALVICSECALKLGDIDIAQQCNVKYFQQSHQYVTQGTEKYVVPIVLEDQWKIRALFVAGILQYEKNKHKRGHKFRKIVLSALQDIVDGISAARKSKRYNFLVYNGSVHFWQIGRCLMKEGMRFLLQPFGKAVVDALADLPEGREDWKANCLVNYSLCLQEVGKIDEATQVISEACQCVAGSQNKSLVSITLGLRTHLLQKSGKLSDKDKKIGDEESECLVLLQAIKSSKMSGEEVEKPLNDLMSKVKDSEMESNDIMADIGWVAYTHGAISIAESCALVAKQSAKDPLARLRADLTLQALEFHQAQPDTSYSVNVDSISKFAETLSSLIRISDASAIQDCCILIWNASLVLQKPTTRKFIMSPFSTAVQILDKMESPLVKLRCQFHLELTKGSLENNLLSNAAKHADRGYYLYETFLSQEQEAKASGPHLTLAKTITELKKVVDMKSNKVVERIDPSVDKQIDYNKLEDCVIQAVENALNAKSQMEKEEILTEAINLVDSAHHSKLESKDINAEVSNEEAGEEEEEGAEQETEVELKPEEVEALQNEVILWNHIVQSAWTAKLDKIVRQAAIRVFPEFSFEKDKHSEAIKVQIDASYADAQSCMFTLNSKGLHLDPPKESSQIDIDPGKPPEEIATDDDLILRACSQFIRGVKLSILLENYTLALNGAIYVWNVFSEYIDINSGEEYDKIVPVMRVLLQQLMKIPSDKQDKNLLCKICNTLACGLEHQVLINWSSKSRSYRVLLIELSKHKTLNLSEEDSKLVEDALQSCESVISLLAEECDSVLFATCARLVRLAGKSPSIKPGQVFESARESISFVIHVIEQVQNEILVGKVRKEVLKDAIKAVKKLEKPFYDLLVQIARASLEKYETHAAIESSAECLKLLGLSENENEALKHTDKTKFQWYIGSACEMIGGEASLQVRQLDSQERSVQLHIYRIAGRKFLKAAKYAYFADHQDMILRAGRLFWNSVLSLMNNPEERNLVVENLEEMFSYIDSSAIYSKDRDLCTLIVRALLETYTEEGCWDEGLKRLTAAFRILPQNEHLSLWKKRTYLLIKAGLNPMNDDVKDHSEDVKAELWLIVARNSYNQEDQYSAYLHACECFAKDAVKSAKYWLVLAEWLMEQSVPQDDIIQVLNKAAATLLLNTKRNAKTESICSKGDPDLFLEGCSVYQISVLLHLFVLKLQIVTNFEDRHYMALCATICCKYLMLKGFHASCVNGETSSGSSFPHKWSDWVQKFLEDGPRDWITCIQSELSYKKYYLYKDLICLADTLHDMKDHGYCIQVCWLLVLFEENLSSSCEDLGYIYASRIFQAAGMFESVRKIEVKIQEKLKSLQNLNLEELGSNMEMNGISGTENWSPILSFLAYIEHFMSRGLYSQSAKLLIFAKDNFKIFDSAPAVKFKYYLLAAELEAAFNRFESASMNLGKISKIDKMKGSLKLWQKYISLYVDVKLGLDQLSEELHLELVNIKSILEMISSERPNTIGSYEVQETLAFIYQKEAELYFLEASEMETSRRSKEKADQKLLEAFSMLDCASQQLKKTGSPTYIDVGMVHVKLLWKKARQDKSNDALHLIIDLLTSADRHCIKVIQCKLGHKDFRDVNGLNFRANGFMPYLRKLGEIRALLGTAKLEKDILTENYYDGKRDHIPQFPKVEGKDPSCIEEFLSDNIDNQGKAIMATNELAGILADESYKLCAEVTKYTPLALNLIGQSLALQDKGLGTTSIDHAIKALQRSFKLSIEENDVDTALGTAECLMGLYLQKGDLKDASLQLFIIQSCKFSLKVPEIIANASNATYKGRILLQTRKKLIHSLLLPSKSEVFNKINDKLESMDEVLSHLSMQLSRDEIAKDLPQGTLFVSFHVGKGIKDPFEDDNLYIACLKKGSGDDDDIEALVESIRYSKGDWDRLFAMISLWKAKSAKFLKDHHVYVDKEMQKPVESSTEVETEVTEDVSIPKSYQVDVKAILADGWKEIVDESVRLLGPLMDTLRTALGIEAQEAVVASTESATEGDAEVSAEEAEADSPKQIEMNICLCVDSALSMVPFEAMEEFRRCLSVTRNQCLVSFCLLNQQLQAAGGKALACGKDFNKLKFIVDPKGQFEQNREEDGEVQHGNICTFFENNLQKQFKEWEGIIGRESLNIGDSYIEQVYDNCSSFMCITPGYFAQVYSPQSIIHTNLKNCKMGFLFDQCIGKNPFLEEKHASQESILEDHYDISTFLMLQGVKTVVVNSMATTNLSCTKFIGSFIEQLGSGKGIAASVREASSTLQEIPDIPPHLPFSPVVYGIPSLTVK